MKSRPNTRKFHRVPLSLEVQFRTKGSFLVSYSRNLSKGGLFLETSDLLPVGTQLTVRLSIPELGDPLETTAKVMWVRRGTSQEGMPPGLGLQFDRLEEHVGLSIDKIIQSFIGVSLVAVADDRAALGRLSRYLNSTLTCQVVETTSAEVLTTGLPGRSDLILLDLDACEDRWRQLLKATTSTDSSVPIIALTSEAVIKSVALQHGASVVLENPPSYEELRLCVLEELGKPHRIS